MAHAPWLLCLAALGYGFASAFIPIVNAEAFVLAGAAAASAASATLAVAAVAVGQSAGKWVMFEAARRGSRRGSAKPKKERTATTEPGPIRAWLADMSSRLLRQLERPVVGPVVVLTSSLVGIPPLAVVAILAGLRRMRTAPFVVAVTVGRLGRFGLLALPVILAKR